MKKCPFSYLENCQENSGQFLHSTRKIIIERMIHISDLDSIIKLQVSLSSEEKR